MNTLIHWFYSRTFSVWYGLSLPLRAGKLILSRPRLIAWSLIPILITALIYLFFIQQIFGWIQPTIHHFFTGLGFSFGSWLVPIVILMTQAIVIILSALTFSFAANIIACPFNDFLAEAAEMYTLPPLPKTKDLSLFLRIKLILIDLFKSMAALCLSAIAFFLSFLPGVNLLAFGITFFLVCFQYISYPQTRRGQGLVYGFRFLCSYPFACSGFGAMLTLMFSIPIVSCLALPMAVVGGTLLVGRAQTSEDLRRLR